jgi:hypothetical protein
VAVERLRRGCTRGAGEDVIGERIVVEQEQAVGGGGLVQCCGAEARDVVGWTREAGGEVGAELGARGGREVARRAAGSEREQAEVAREVIGGGGPAPGPGPDREGDERGDGDAAGEGGREGEAGDRGGRRPRAQVGRRDAAGVEADGDAGARAAVLVGREAGSARRDAGVRVGHPQRAEREQRQVPEVREAGLHALAAVLEHATGPSAAEDEHVGRADCAATRTRFARQIHRVAAPSNARRGRRDQAVWGFERCAC